METERTGSQTHLASIGENGLSRWDEDPSPIDCVEMALRSCIPDADWDSDHMARTPERFMRLLQNMTATEEFNFTVFDNEADLDEMIIIQDIPFYSLCAHHIVPFFGKAHIAYIPGDCIAGLSKFARAVAYNAKGLWVQEHLTDSIANFLEDHLRPKGLAVVLTGEHLCMSMRGAQVPGTRTTSSSMRGVFLDPSKKARDEFLSIIYGGR